MKTLLYILLVLGFLIGCNTSKRLPSTSSEEIQTASNDTVKIANDELEYQIIIIEPGFNNWLLGTARPKGYYSQQFLENRNYILVNEWNRRVINPSTYNPNLYEMQIDYRQGIDYGYDVNYQLYNYFVYFQLKYNQRLAGFVPRI